MKKISFLELDRTTTSLLPGEPRPLPAPQLGPVLETLFELQDNPASKRARMQMHLLERQRRCECPSCGARVQLDGYRRTKTSYKLRDEWRCGDCLQRFLVAEEHYC